jgi:hypothetical protein
LLVAGFPDGTARAFCLLSDGNEDANSSERRNCARALGPLENAHFLHAATFVNPTRQEAAAFAAAACTTDGSAVVLLLGSMGGRSMFSTSMTHLNDLQPIHNRQGQQDCMFPSAMLWPLELGRTMLVADCESRSVDEIDVLTGEPARAAQNRDCPFFPNASWPMFQATPGTASCPFRTSTGPPTSPFRPSTFSTQKNTGSRCWLLAVTARCIWRRFTYACTSVAHAFASQLFFADKFGGSKPQTSQKTQNRGPNLRPVDAGFAWLSHPAFTQQRGVSCRPPLPFRPRRPLQRQRQRQRQRCSLLFGSCR